MMPKKARTGVDELPRDCKGLIVHDPAADGASMREYLERWFPFRGRIGRRQYWISTLLYVIVWIVGAAILVVFASLNYTAGDTITDVTIADFILLGIAMTVFVFAIVNFRP